MIKQTAIFLAFAMFITFASGTCHAAEPFPDLQLNGKLSASDADYLGLPEGTTQFALTDIKANVIFVEVFSMYCPICQRDAAIIERLYDRVDKEGYRPGLAMLGIGAGNSQYEADVYEKKYSVKMPLVPDGNFVIHGTLGNVGTPYYLLLKKNQDNTLTVLFSQEGGVSDAKAFMQKILKLAQTAE